VRSARSVDVNFGAAVTCDGEEELAVVAAKGLWGPSPLPHPLPTLSSLLLLA
jgi:hypothetical protein